MAATWSNRCFTKDLVRSDRGGREADGEVAKRSNVRSHTHTSLSLRPFNIVDTAAETAGHQLALKPIKSVGLAWRGGK